MVSIQDAYEMFSKSPSTLILGFIQCPCAGCIWLRKARKVAGVDNWKKIEEAKIKRIKGDE